MPRRRYISTKASTDQALSGVSERASNAFLLSIPHADCCGRLPGAAFEYGALVLAGRHYRTDTVASILAELLAAGLYVAWDGVIAFKGESWFDLQGRALNDLSRPEWSDPPDGVGGVAVTVEDPPVDGKPRRHIEVLPQSSAIFRESPQSSATPPSPSPSPSPTPTPSPPPIPLVPKTLRVSARSADELQADIDSILAETEHPELYRAVADLMAGANKTGKVSGTRLLTALYEPLWAEERRYRESNLAPAFEEGLRAAVQAGAFAVNYVKRAAESMAKRVAAPAIKRQTAGPRDKNWSEE